MKNILKGLLLTTAVAAAVGATPVTANAAPAWSCSTITKEYMYFDNAPIHSAPAGSAKVIASTGSDPMDINASCISDAGQQWWRSPWVGAYTYGYIYDGYRD